MNFQKKCRSGKPLGRWGEDTACAFLRGCGYRILERNRFAEGYEIDVIAADEDFIVFAEVKTRLGLPGGTPRPGTAVNYTKQQRILTAAGGYLRETGCGGQPRIDVIEVYAREASSAGVDFYELIKVIHIRNAFGIK